MTNENEPIRQLPVKIGQVARSPIYFSRFADSFYDEYVESAEEYVLHYSDSGTPIFSRSLNSLSFMGMLFIHVRAAIYLYRQLNFKRLLSKQRLWADREISRLEFAGSESVPEFRGIVSERLSGFLASEWQGDARLPLVPDLSIRFVPAFMHSTDVVINDITEDLSQAKDRWSSYFASLGKLDSVDAMALPIRAVSSARKIQRLYEATGISDREISRSIERYEKAVKLLHRPPGLYGMPGIERLYVAGLELSLMQRLSGQMFSRSIDNNAEIMDVIRTWRSAHEALMSNAWEVTPELFWHHPSLPGKRRLDVNRSISNQTVIGEYERFVRPVAKSREKILARLPDILPAHATKLPETRSPVGETWRLGTSMVKDYPHGVIRIFSAGTCAVAIGLAATLSGLLLNEFSVTYTGVGLIALGISTVTLTLFHAVQFQSPDQ